jgi:peptidoglycan/xylan/chitin deacetylase (PgdA/CDA1 family)
VIGRLPEAVMYHYVRDAKTTPPLGYRSLDVARFDAQLDAICRTRTPVGWSAVLAALRGEPALPGDAVVLTFDDGLADHHRHVLPRLAARGLQGVFFVLARGPEDGLALGHRIHVLGGVMDGTSIRDEVRARLGPEEARAYLSLEADLRTAGLPDPDDPWKLPLQRELEIPAGRVLSELIEERLGPEADVARALYLDMQQVGDLAGAGMTIGGHGRDHPWLDWIGRGRARREVLESAAFLATVSPGPWPFAYPYGGVPRRPGALLDGAGFAAAFTTRAWEHHDRFRIGRHDGDELGRDGIPKPGGPA